MRKGMLAPSLVGVIALIVFAGLSAIIFATMGALQAKFTKEAIVGLEYHPTVAEDALMSLMEVEKKVIPPGTKIDIYFVVDNRKRQMDLSSICDKINEIEEKLNDQINVNGDEVKIEKMGISSGVTYYALRDKYGRWPGSSATEALPCSTKKVSLHRSFSDQYHNVVSVGYKAATYTGIHVYLPYHQYTGAYINPGSWAYAVYVLASKERGSVPTGRVIWYEHSVDIKTIEENVWRGEAVKVIVPIGRDAYQDDIYNPWSDCCGVEEDSDTSNYDNCCWILRLEPIREVVPIDIDKEKIEQMVSKCRQNDITLFPISGSSAGKCQEDLAKKAGKETGGVAFSFSDTVDTIVDGINECVGEKTDGKIKFREAAIQASYEWSTETWVQRGNSKVYFELYKRAKEYLDYALAGKEYLLFFYDENRVGEEYNRMLPLATNIISYDLITDVSADRWKKLIKQFEDSPYPVSASVPLIDGRWLVLYVKEGSE